MCPLEYFEDALCAVSQLPVCTVAVQAACNHSTEHLSCAYHGEIVSSSSNFDAQKVELCLSLNRMADDVHVVLPG